MAYHFDSRDQSIVIDGFQAGISDDPFSGIAAMQNANIISVPGEASCSFSTFLASPAKGTSGSVTSVSANVVTFTGLTNPTNATAVSFTSVGSYSGITAGTTVYWLGNVTASTAKLYSNMSLSSLVTVTGSGTANFTVYNMFQPQAFCFSNPTDGTDRNYYMVDLGGQVWAALEGDATTPLWRFTGNTGHLGGDNTCGNGIGYYKASNGTGYVFVFSDSQIDYAVDNANTLTWVYGWDPGAGTSGNTGNYLYGPAGSGVTGSQKGISHDCLVGQDNVFYFCDTNHVCSFFEKPGQNFNPLTASTYTYAGKSSTPASYALLLPIIDNANCLAELGTNLLVGGQRNLIYPWNRIATSFTYPIFLSENVVSKMITLNTNTYIFVGNRGRVYITNGTQASLFKKVPDHISGTIEPYFSWGGVTSTKNQMYFSAMVTTNAGSALNQYGGVWAIDMDSQVIRLTNTLSYNTTNNNVGFASAMIAQVPAVNDITTQPGTGLYIGWDNGSSLYGIDGTQSQPYIGTNSSTVIDSDLIPIGTFNEPRNFTQIEYRLTKPMVAGESITINYRLDFSQAWTQVTTDNTVGHFSNIDRVNFANAQWVQFQIVTVSTATNPSYTRLKEMRVLGMVGPSMAQAPQLSV